MAVPKLAPEPDVQNDWPFELMNLYPRHTGLPMTLWVGPRAGAKHDARVKVSMSHGDRMDIDNLAIVALRPEPKVLEGELARRDLDLVRRWIELNRSALIEHWEGHTDGVELARALRPL